VELPVGEGDGENVSRIVASFHRRNRLANTVLRAGPVDRCTAGPGYRPGIFGRHDSGPTQRRSASRITRYSGLKAVRFGLLGDPFERLESL
jgi:hypothetical protein